MNEQEPDKVEEVIKHAHIILPIMGAFNMFIMIAIAIIVA